MARTNNLTNFLTDVANAIRTKKGTSASIAASNFDSEIAGIQTGVNVTIDGVSQTEDLTLHTNSTIGTWKRNSNYDIPSSVEYNGTTYSGLQFACFFELNAKLYCIVYGYNSNKRYYIILEYNNGWINPQMLYQATNLANVPEVFHINTTYSGKEYVYVFIHGSQCFYIRNDNGNLNFGSISMPNEYNVKGATLYNGYIYVSIANASATTKNKYKGTVRGTSISWSNVSASTERDGQLFTYNNKLYVIKSGTLYMGEGSSWGTSDIGPTKTFISSTSSNYFRYGKIVTYKDDVYYICSIYSSGSENTQSFNLRYNHNTLNTYTWEMLPSILYETTGEGLSGEGGDVIIFNGLILYQSNDGKTYTSNITYNK